MADRDGGRSYEPPRVVQLSTRSDSGGFCFDGSSDVDACDVGNAAIRCENDGNSATLRCDNLGNGPD